MKKKKKSEKFIFIKTSWNPSHCWPVKAISEVAYICKRVYAYIVHFADANIYYCITLSSTPNLSWTPEHRNHWASGRRRSAPELSVWNLLKMPLLYGQSFVRTAENQINRRTHIHMCTGLHKTRAKRQWLLLACRCWWYCDFCGECGVKMAADNAKANCAVWHMNEWAAQCSAALAIHLSFPL